MLEIFSEYVLLPSANRLRDARECFQLHMLRTLHDESERPVVLYVIYRRLKFVSSLCRDLLCSRQNQPNQTSYLLDLCRSSRGLFFENEKSIQTNYNAVAGVNDHIVRVIIFYKDLLIFYT